MLCCKRALALWLGLFFYLLSPLGARENPASVSGEVSAGAGTLWVDDDGGAFFWRTGLKLDTGPRLFLRFGLGKVSSNLPPISGSVLGFTGRFGIDAPRGGFFFAFGLFNQQPVTAAMEKVTVSNDGGRGYFLQFKTPLRFGPFGVTPCFVYGSADWAKGDLYWFFGKPDLPSLFVYGCDFGLEHHERYGHGLVFRRLSADLNITGNENGSLFDTRINAGLFLYRFSLETLRTSFTGSLGWLYSGASFDGALTASNQPYFLFPFLSFDITAEFEIQAGLAAFGFRRRRGIVLYGFDLGAFHIFFDRGGVDTHYKMKRLFGGKEDSERIEVELKGFGGAFLLLKAELPELRVGTGGGRLSLGARKAFVVPWGYDKFLPSGTGSDGTAPDGAFPPPETDSRSLIRTILLSGLSVQGSFSW
jgi:hypothetical protein